MMIIKYFKIILFLLLWNVFSLAYAETNPSQDLIQYLNSLETMQANFTQIVYDNHGKAVQQSSGKIFLKRPGQFRWEVKNPIPQLIVANQSRLWIYDIDLEQVTVRLLKNTADVPALLLSKNVDLNRDYAIQELAPNKNLRWFQLTPKNQDSAFKSIKLGFLNGKIQQMKLQDHLGHTTAIQFSHLKINQGISSELFHLKIPSHADVIDETKSI